MYGYTGNNWGHRNSNKSFKEKFGSRTGNTVNRSTTIGSGTLNIKRYGKYCSPELEA